MEAIALSVLSSFIAASLFLIFLSKLRPTFKVSKKIAFMEQADIKEFSIKILNKGARNAINIKAEVDLMTSKIVPDGTILSHKPIQLKKSSRMILAKYDKKDSDATYAYRITITDDLDSLWIDEANQFVRVKIYAQDEMSNFGRVFIREYRTKRNSLKQGEFRFGNTTDIA